ncbi:MAG TPA: metalloregulator ArsR/SmtB family transcription factor [Microbacterium sp.]|nr:metalloregulator ArsR/SmtB family transcription factor [Microbacterium sp.]
MDVYQALADDTRRLILDELHARDGRSLFDICTTLLTRHRVELTRQAISHHLSVLESAGLVNTEKRGRVKFHFIDTGPLAEIQRRWTPPGKVPT